MESTQVFKDNTYYHTAEWYLKRELLPLICQNQLWQRNAHQHKPVSHTQIRIWCPVTVGSKSCVWSLEVRLVYMPCWKVESHQEVGSVFGELREWLLVLLGKPRMTEVHRCRTALGSSLRVRPQGSSQTCVFWVWHKLGLLHSQGPGSLLTFAVPWKVCS